MSAKRIHLAFIAACMSCGAAELHWRNGEQVEGELTGAEAGNVTWRAPMFTTPFQVRRDVLSRITQRQESAETAEAFSIHLADGSRLYGDITGWGAETVEVRSARSGTLRIARAAIMSVQRMKSGGMLYATPASTSGWITSDKRTDAPAPLWRVAPGAALRQIGWNRAATLPLVVPERVEMEITLSSSVRPEFKIDLKATDNERMTVETWVDDVVLQGRAFQSVRKLTADDHRLTLTVFWDRKSGLCAVYGADGRKIVETQKPPISEKTSDTKEKKKTGGNGGGAGLFGALLGVVQNAVQAKAAAVVEVRDRARRASTPQGPPKGFTLLNKGPDLTLEALRIRAWSGTLPTSVPRMTPCVDLVDGRSLAAVPAHGDTRTLTLHGVGGKETAVPWSQVLALRLAVQPAPFFHIAPPSVELWFTDGEWAQGTLHSIRDDTATLAVAWSDKPVTFKMTHLSRLEFKTGAAPAPEAELATLDTLMSGKTTLHGTLEADGTPLPLWRPHGALTAVSISSAGEMEITRGVSERPIHLRSDDALFYLSSGDVAPGKLRAIDEKEIDFESNVATATHLGAGKVQAVQFGGAVLNLDGFSDPGWRRVHGGTSAVQHMGPTLTLRPGGSWGHPSFMQVNEMRFTLHSDSFSALRMRLFCGGVDPATPSTNLIFGHMGSEACFGLEANGGQLDRQFRLNTGASLAVRVMLTQTTLEVFLNGIPARKIILNPKIRSGSGIILEPFGLWGNSERDVKISDFGARITPGSVTVPNVDAKAKEHALTVPRFRKEDPPKHALLAANGDLLRGVIEAATAQHFSVRSGLETIQVPRDRVKAAVWLVKPVDAVSAAFEARAKEGEPPLITHWLLLNNGGRLGLKVERFDPDAVIGRNELLGTCHVPLNEIYVIRNTPPPSNAAMLALSDWKLIFAPEPVLPETGGESSPLLHQPAKSFRLPLLAGGDFDLAHEQGKVIVLDFWATWCGPCVKSLPGLIDEMAAFDPKKVRFIGVNQAEPKAQVQTFLETRGWKMEVALDADQRVGQSFGVEGIPHTVVIGPDGKVAYVKTGYEPDGAKKTAEAVRKLLGE